MNFDNIKEMAELTNTAIEIEKNIDQLARFGSLSIEDQGMILKINASYRHTILKEEQVKIPQVPFISIFAVNPQLRKIAEEYSANEEREAIILIESDYIPSLIDWLILMERDKQIKILAKLKSLQS